MSEPVWIFLHLPKSGGTTFKTHLERHLRWDEELIEFTFWGYDYRRQHGRAEFGDRPEAERQQARVLAGHRVDFGVHLLLPDREPRYFTFLRDPAERCVSLYNFRRSRGQTDLDFAGWYASDYLARDRDSMVRFYAERLAGQQLGGNGEQHLAMAKQLLERCWLVGFTERLDETLGPLCDAIGIPRGWETQRAAGSSDALESATHPAQGEVIARHFTLDDCSRAQIYADSPNDIALYRWALERDQA